jgi:transglutaminase-like putative cysteine protease
MTTLNQYTIEFDYYFDLPETQGIHEIMISAWDLDAFDDDRIDINPDSNWNSYVFNLDSTVSVAGFSSTAMTVSGLGDGIGWDGELSFSYELVDMREQRMNMYTWEYDNREFSMNLILDYALYAEAKNQDHTVGGIYDVASYARFSTPHEDYVVQLANDLENMAVSNGYTSTLEIAEFVYAFVGAIQYVLDSEGVGVSDYPKYPIEMLWDASGDCEDAAIMYVSLIEALGYDALFTVGLVKQSSDEDWSGHAWALVHIPNHSGAGWYGPGAKSGTPFYFVEATAYRDGTSYIGRNPWYDTSDVSVYDVE